MSRISDLNPNLKLNDDERAQLSLTAHKAEKAAKPTHLLVLAGSLLLVATLALMSSASKLSDATKSMNFQNRLAEDMVAEVATLKQLRDASTSSGPTAGDELNTIRSRISQAAAGVGIKNADKLLPDSNQANPQRPGANSVQRLFKYTVQNDTLGPLLEWMAAAPQQVPGLEVYQLKLTPHNNDWTLNVTFSRWERVKPK